MVGSVGTPLRRHTTAHHIEAQCLPRRRMDFARSACYTRSTRRAEAIVRPDTQYARSGAVHIAYQVLGNGPLDLVSAPGWISHIEYDWELPAYTRFHERLASFSRLIRFDKRGTGL